MFVHTRRQLPVGQGGFHVAEIVSGTNVFRYVYDCGSDYATPLGREVKEYVASLRDAAIDVLFVSHLDYDHVSGLSSLLLKAHVATVVLPYLTAYERLIGIAEATERDVADDGLIDLLSDPRTYFNERGVRNLIEVKPDGPPNSEGFPADNISWLKASGKIELEWPVKLNSTKRSALASLQMPSSAQLHLKIGGHRVNWQLLTYVHPEPQRVVTFRQEVVNRFGHRLVRGDGTSIRQRELRRVLQNEESRKLLAECYRVIQVNRNLTSMSLYSGPSQSFDFDNVNLRVNYQCHAAKRVRDGIGLYDWGGLFPHAGKVGWLAVGDYDLRSAPRRESLRRHFESCIPFVGTMSLPHHGSRYNFHEDLCDWTDRFIVAAGEQNKYEHPHRDVLAKITRPVILTDETTSSEMSERIAIGL